jgi:folate-binding protein YgfZ
MNPPIVIEATPQPTALVNALASLRPDVHASNYRGAIVPEQFSSSDDEFRHLVSDMVVMDQGWRRRLQLTGEDRVRWLNGILTNNIAGLAEGAGNYSFLLSPQGRLQGDVYTYISGDSAIVETDAAQLERVRAWFDHYIIMDDVNVEDAAVQSSTLALAGGGAEAVLAKLGVDAAGLKPLQLQATQIANVAVTIVRDDTAARPLFSLWCDDADVNKLWQALVAAGAHPAGWRTAELLRIASGTPLFGKDISDRYLAQETGQDRALHFSKGCYIGQEIVERIRSRGQVHRGWAGFTIDLEAGAALPETPAPVTSNGESVGELTSVALLPLSDGPRAVGLGIVRNAALAAGTALSTNNAALNAARPPFI